VTTVRANARDVVRPGVVGPLVNRQDCDVSDILSVVVDNESAKARNRSVVRLKSRSVPGLMRSVAWVLNGMDLVGHECSIATDAEGIVDMTFEVTERAGPSGKSEQMIVDAALVIDRLRDYLAKCIQSGSDELDDAVLHEDGVCVDNRKIADATYVSVKISEKVATVISLYPIGNTFTGLDLVVKNGKLTKYVDTSTGVPMKMWEFEVLRLSDRKKLTQEQLQPLMYTLALVCSPSSFGKSHAFTN
jgi:hypothetical protein